MRRSVSFFLRAILIIGLFSAAAFAQSQTSAGCAPSPEIAKALKQLPEYRQEARLTDWQVYQRRFAGIEALRRQYPNDVFVARSYIRFATSMRGTDKASLERKARIDSEFLALHQQHPESAQGDMLYAETLVGRDTPQAIQLFNTALQQDPGFPLPHSELAIVYSLEAFRDKDRSVAQLKAFMDACPASLEGYELVSRITSDHDLLKKYAAQLRIILGDRSDIEAVGAYRMLWALEFKAHPSSEYVTLGKQVAADLVRIRQLKLENERDWYDTLEEGYKLANDSKQADLIEEQRGKRVPSPDVAERTSWHKDHPEPEGDADQAARDKYYRALLIESGKWLNLPQPSATVTFEILGDRLNAMTHLSDVPSTDLVAAVEQRLKAAGENGGGSPWSIDFSPWSDDYQRAAQILYKKHIAPEHVIEYSQKGLAILEADTKQPLPDFWTKQIVEEVSFYRNFPRIDMLKYEISGYLQLKQVDKAAPLLAQLDTSIQNANTMAGDNEERKQLCTGSLADYWGLKGQKAELYGQNIDAMSFYQNALLIRLNAKIKPPADERDELADNAHRLWISLKGSEDAWQQWYGRAANDLATTATLSWQKSNQPLAAFELPDLSDKKWNLDSFKGKVTLISFWATWCGPCREELPHLQTLVARYKDRTDVQFISMNMDDNPGLIQPFLKEHQLSITVIPAFNYVTETLNVNGIPQNWIVDQQGVVRRKAEGYGPEEKWVPAMQNAIEEVKSTAPVTH